MKDSVSLRALIVEDSSDTSAALGLYLRVQGHEVLVVSSAEAAIAEIDLFRPDVILLDIRLPKLNGFELCGLIRSMRQHQHVLVIAMSAWDFDPLETSGAEAGCDHFLPKPIDLKKLDAILARYQLELRSCQSQSLFGR